MRKTQLSELLQTVETLRSELYPELDRNFLAAVIAAEDENPEPEDEQAALRQIQAAIEEVLSPKETSSRKEAFTGKGAVLSKTASSPKATAPTRQAHSRKPHRLRQGHR